MNTTKGYSKQLLAVLLAGVVMLTIYLLNARSSSVQTETSDALPVIVQKQTENVNPVRKPARSPIDEPVTPIKSFFPELADQLRDAKDLRKFSVEVQAHVAVGGISYAIHATDLCRNLRMALENASIPWDVADLPYAAPEDPRVHAVKNAALHRAKAACQGFSSSDFEDSHLPAKALAQKDPIFELKSHAQGITSASSLEDRRTVLGAVLDNGDPLLISQTLQGLLLSDKAGGGVGIWIDGEQKPVMSSEIYFSALQVVHCRLGLPCGELSHDVLDACIATGECLSNRIDLFRARMTPEDRPEFDLALAKLASAIRERNVDGFLPR